MKGCGTRMNIYFEPVNVNQWNMFEKVSGVGHVEPFLAVKSMVEDDLVLLHVGSQNKKYKREKSSIWRIIKLYLYCGAE